MSHIRLWNEEAVRVIRQLELESAYVAHDASVVHSSVIDAEKALELYEAGQGAKLFIDVTYRELSALLSSLEEWSAINDANYEDEAVEKQRLVGDTASRILATMLVHPSVLLSGEEKQNACVTKAVELAELLVLELVEKGYRLSAMLPPSQPPGSGLISSSRT